MFLALMHQKHWKPMALNLAIVLYHHTVCLIFVIKEDSTLKEFQWPLKSHYDSSQGKHHEVQLHNLEELIAVP